MNDDAAGAGAAGANGEGNVQSYFQCSPRDLPCNRHLKALQQCTREVLNFDG